MNDKEVLERFGLLLIGLAVGMVIGGIIWTMNSEVKYYIALILPFILIIIAWYLNHKAAGITE